jgi:hypothetical protein
VRTRTLWDSHISSEEREKAQEKVRREGTFVKVGDGITLVEQAAPDGSC